MSSNGLDVPSMVFQGNVEILVKNYSLLRERKDAYSKHNLKWIKKLNIHDI